MPPGRYAKPPITEAIVQLTFDHAASSEAMKRFLRQVKGQYPNVEETFEVSVTFAVGAAATTNQKSIGYKATSSEPTDVLLLHPDRIATIRLAPYSGWEDVLEKTKRNYEALKKVVGFRALTRVATRYVNRIDIPTGGRPSIEINDYVVVEPRVPVTIPNLHAFTTQFAGSIPAAGYQVVVNTGSVASPLIDHFSILLDIDVIKDKNVPQKEAELWEFLEDFRRQKDDIFEAFVTDRARELFDRA